MTIFDLKDYYIIAFLSGVIVTILVPILSVLIYSIIQDMKKRRKKND